MAVVKYVVVPHDGGYAYRVGDTFSETFPTHDEAEAAARIAAGEQKVSGETVDISWEDDKGRWHGETALGQDRPDTEVDP
ncbi:MAG: DUF2188 domain-containing protein [Rhizobiaceae bacterium]|nr:DUF2188 domain-containing protein [Rhizobiaceae bacterium]